MAGQLKEVRNRIKSVQSTQQITKAMKMVSAAKLRRAQDAIVQMRPYAKKLQEMLSNIVSSSSAEVSMPLAEERNPERVLLIPITSDRGLCGGVNSTIIREVKKAARTIPSENLSVRNPQLLLQCLIRISRSPLLARRARPVFFVSSAV